MKDRINRYIPMALQKIKEKLAASDEVDERYDGYAASLGPAIITSGLKSAIAFYTDVHRINEESANEPKRFHILQIISSMLAEDGEPINNVTAENALLVHLMVPSNNTMLLKQKIMDAIVAIKLAFRNFKQVKKS